VNYLTENILRFMSSFLCGYIMTMSGSLVQIITNNSLASPSTLGFNAIIVLIVLVIYLFPIDNYILNIELISFIIFTLLFLVLLFTRFIKTRLNKEIKNYNFLEKIKKFPKDIILIGLSLNLLLGAFCSLIQFYFISMNKNFPSQLWYGNFKFVTSISVISSIVIFLIFVLYIFLNARKIELISYGVDLALGLGVNVKKIITSTIFISFLGCGLIGCFYGIFSFYGLILPHLIRSIKVFKYSVYNELVFGPLIGGFFLFCLDLFCYEFPIHGAEIPVGILSSILGTGLLLWVIVKNKIIQ
jgi:iron complex transport system permease protein